MPIWLAVVATSLPMFMATLDNLVMTSALPVIRTDLAASVDDLAWFVNAYTLAFATFMLPAATLGDRWGRRRVMLGGLALFTVASIASALSLSSGALIAARAVQGLGAAAVMPLSLTLLAAAVPVAMRPVAIGIWGGVSGLGVALGPVIGGAVVEGVSWQAIFWLNVPVALVAGPLLWFAVSESFGRRQRIDVRGTLMIGGAVFLGIWGIVHGNDDGWASARVLLPLVAAALLVPAYVAHARSATRRDFAVLPLRLFASRGFSVANVIGLSFTIGMFGAVFLLAQNLQIVMGYSPLEAGLRTLPWTAAPMVVAPIAGALASRTGLRALLVTGLVLQAGRAGVAGRGHGGRLGVRLVRPRPGDGRHRDGADLRAERHRGARRDERRRLRHRELGELHDPRVRRRARGGRPDRGVPGQRRRADADRLHRRDRPRPAGRRGRPCWSRSSPRSSPPAAPSLTRRQWLPKHR